MKRTLAGMGEYEGVFESMDQLAEYNKGDYAWETYTDPQTGQVVQDAIVMPSTATIDQLASLGVSIAKIYTMANGQQVKYVPIQTATGVQYQRQAAGIMGMLSNPYVIASVGVLAILLLKGK